MTTYELRQRLDKLSSKIGYLADEIRSLRDQPRIDEDYKLEWPENQPFTVELFEELDRLADALIERWPE